MDSAAFMRTFLKTSHCPLYSWDGEIFVEPFLQNPRPPPEKGSCMYHTFADRRGRKIAANRSPGALLKRRTTNALPSTLVYLAYLLETSLAGTMYTVYITSILHSGECAKNISPYSEKTLKVV